MLLESLWMVTWEVLLQWNLPPCIVSMKIWYWINGAATLLEAKFNSFIFVLNKVYTFNYDSYISYLIPETNVSLRTKFIR